MAGMPWMPIRIWIRQNDSDPTRFGSGSTTLESVSPKRNGPDTSYSYAESLFLTGARHTFKVPETESTA
jgi:hypothetical protein